MWHCHARPLVYFPARFSRWHSPQEFVVLCGDHYEHAHRWLAPQLRALARRVARESGRQPAPDSAAAARAAVAAAALIRGWLARNA